jgi:hypothetical protein
VKNLLLQDGVQRSNLKKVEPVVDFLNKSVTMGIPANTIIFVDTHSCGRTGCLQYGGGRTNAKVVGLKDVSVPALFWMTIADIPF